MMLQQPLHVRLTKEEMAYIRRCLDREPNTLEWGIFEIMYSEHCSYKSSRKALKQLLTEGRRVLLGPGNDAGVIDIGKGYAVAFKIESHNHPSALDPYNGAATGVGGIVRDIFAVGARPIALLDNLRFGSLESKHSQWLLRYVVKGIGDYGNCIGVPTVSGDVEFDESFETNCLVNVACIGLARKDRIVTAALREPGDLLVLVGGATGCDGIHGVTFASKTLTLESEDDRSSVQVGDPFTEKLGIEVCNEAVDAGILNAMKDLGGGGLTCAVSEMCAKGGTGVDVNLNALHVREKDLTPYELMLSESQERMLLAVKPALQHRLFTLLEKYEIPYSVIGKVTNTGRVVVRWNGEVVADLPAKLIVSTPATTWPTEKDSVLKLAEQKPLPPLSSDLGRVLIRLLASPTIASKNWVYEQYDHEVGIRTILKPGVADAAVLCIPEADCALAVKGDGNSRQCYLDPYQGSMGVLAECCRNVTAVGGFPVAYVDGCNFGSPENPVAYGQFNESMRGLAYMSRKLGIPCVGGNVSFYNEDKSTGYSIKPTLFVVVVGLIKDINRITTMALKSPGSAILVIGETGDELGGSEYLYNLPGNISTGKPPFIHASREIKANRIVEAAIRKKLVSAVHDCSKGGLGIAVALMCIKGQLGATIHLEKMLSSIVTRLDVALFSESHGRYVLEVPRENLKELEKLISHIEYPATVIGETQAAPRLRVQFHGKPLIDKSLDELRTGWHQTISSYMGEEI